MFLLLYRGKHGLRHIHLQPFKRSRHSSVLMNFQGGEKKKNKKSKAAVTLRFSIDFHKFSMGDKQENKCVLKTKTKRGMSAERVQDPTETNYMVTSCARNVEDVQGASFMKR